jgi:hypothetical protein
MYRKQMIVGGQNEWEINTVVNKEDKQGCTILTKPLFQKVNHLYKKRLCKRRAFFTNHQQVLNPFAD